jgi:hypothetical protein
MGVKLGLSHKGTPVEGIREWPLKDGVTGDWRRLHNEELRDLYSSLDIITVIIITKDEMSCACGTHVRQERCVENFGGEI